MADQNRDEKELRKREEKAPEEKQWDEKYRRDPLGAVIWPIILIWAGLVFLASNLGFLSFLAGGNNPWGIDVWSLVFLGVGVILFLEVLARMMIPEFRRPVLGTVILAIIFVGIGLGGLVNWGIIWPLILIVIGISILTRGTWRAR
ncbi:MAG: hypothetical protein ACM3JD_14275 [Rudaea sp.]